MLWKDNVELVGMVYCYLSSKSRGVKKVCFSGGVEGEMEENRLEVGGLVRRLVLRLGEKC